MPVSIAPTPKMIDAVQDEHLPHEPPETRHGMRRLPTWTRVLVWVVTIAAIAAAIVRLSQR